MDPEDPLGGQRGAPDPDEAEHEPVSKEKKVSTNNTENQPLPTVNALQFLAQCRLRDRSTDTLVANKNLTESDTEIARLKQFRSDISDTDDQEYDQDETARIIVDETDEVHVDDVAAMYGPCDFTAYDSVENFSHMYDFDKDMCLQRKCNPTSQPLSDNGRSDSASSLTLTSEFDEQTTVLQTATDGFHNVSFDHELDGDKSAAAEPKSEWVDNMFDRIHENEERLNEMALNSDFLKEPNYEWINNCHGIDNYLDEDYFGEVGDCDDDDVIVGNEFDLADDDTSYSADDEVIDDNDYDEMDHCSSRYDDLAMKYKVSMAGGCYEQDHGFSYNYKTDCFEQLNKTTSERIWIYIPELDDAASDRFVDFAESIKWTESGNDEDYMSGVEGDYHEDINTSDEYFNDDDSYNAEELVSDSSTLEFSESADSDNSDISLFSDDSDENAWNESSWMRILNDAVREYDTEHSDTDFRDVDDHDADCYEKEEWDEAGCDDYMNDNKAVDEDGEDGMISSKLKKDLDANVKERKPNRMAQTNEDLTTALRDSTICENHDAIESDNESSACEHETSREVLEYDSECDSGNPDIVNKTALNDHSPDKSNNDIKHFLLNVYSSIVNVYNFVEAEMLENNFSAGVREEINGALDKVANALDEEYSAVSEEDVALDSDVYQETAILHNTPVTGSVAGDENVEDTIVNTCPTEVDASSEKEQYQTCCFPLALFRKKPKEMHTDTSNKDVQNGKRTKRSIRNVTFKPDFKTQVGRPGWFSNNFQVIFNTKRSKR